VFRDTPNRVFLLEHPRTLTTSKFMEVRMTDMQILYGEVFDQIRLWVLLGGAIFGIALGTLISLRTGGCSLVPILGIISLVVHSFFASGTAETKAVHATTIAWEGARDEQATYREKLHGYWTGIREDIHTCKYSSLSKENTGCVYVTKTCIEDEDGWEDCDYTPWFDYERDLIGLNDIYKNNEIVFATHLAPLDWKSNQYGIFNSAVPLWATAGTDFQYENDPDWTRIEKALSSGVVLPATVYNNYLNFIHANDLDLMRLNGNNIPKYKSANLLPEINLINGLDYNVVQFVGGIQLSQPEITRWQKIAHDWAGQAGPGIETSLILVFAPETEVADKYEWVNTSKAHLMKEEIFGKDILPKNLVLIMCTVDVSLSTITGCEMQTGMFEGNNDTIDEVRNIGPFPFTPEAVFGIFTTSYRMNGSEYFTENGEYAIDVNFIETGTIHDVLFDPNTGFTRQEMEEKEYLRTSIQPTPEQIVKIKNDELMSLMTTLGTIYGSILLVVARVVTKSHD